MKIRFFQQIRLWIYTILLVALFLSDFSIYNMFIFILLFTLFYIEICPTCGRLVWWENNKWPNTFWISKECKNINNIDENCIH